MICKSKTIDSNSQFFSAVSVDQTTGWVAVAWYDARQDPTNTMAQLYGIVADGTSGGTIRGLVSDSFVTNNRNNGITASTAGSSTVLTVDNTKVSGNAFGLVAGGSNAGLLVRRSIVNGNATGLFATGGGALLSYRDNSLNGNFTTDGAFTGAVTTQ